MLVGGQDANLAQVRNGMAWVYRQYAREQAYFAAEDAAKAARLGLWSRPDAVPPWEYRHGGKRGADAQSGDRVSAKTSLSANGACGVKQYCKQMRDCAEARHYLVDCGLTKLDRDGDGFPCESLCK